MTIVRGVIILRFNCWTAALFSEHSLFGTSSEVIGSCSTLFANFKNDSHAINVTGHRLKRTRLRFCVIFGEQIYQRIISWCKIFSSLELCSHYCHWHFVTA